MLLCQIPSLFPPFTTIFSHPTCPSDEVSVRPTAVPRKFSGFGAIVLVGYVALADRLVLRDLGSLVDVTASWEKK